MNLTFVQLRDVQHLAIDFHIEYDAAAFSELYIDPATKVPEFKAVDKADTGESRLYFTYSDPTSGDCDQFHINNVSDALGAVATVASIYRTLNYQPTDLIRSFETVSSDDIKLLSLLGNDFSIHVVGTYSGDVHYNEQLGAVYHGVCKDPNWIDIYLSYKKSSEIELDFTIEEIGASDILSELLDVAKMYSELIDTPLEMAKYF